MIVSPQVMQPQPSLLGSIGKTLLNIGTSFIPGNQFFKGLFGLGSNVAGNALFGNNSQALPITGYEYKQNAPQSDYTAHPQVVTGSSDVSGRLTERGTLPDNIDPDIFKLLYSLNNDSDLYGGYYGFGNQIFGRRF